MTDLWQNTPTESVMTDIHELFPEEPKPDEMFNEFWKRYPSGRKASKPLCKKKWDAITGPGLKTRTLDKDSGTYVDIELQATPEEILAGLKAWIKTLSLNPDYSYKDPQYLPQCSTWLNQGRFWDYE